jgi:predicted kinase
MKKDNLKILILIGIPASGKSTWSKDFVRNNEKWVRVGCSV